MKKAGLIIVAFGLILILFTGFNYVTKEKIVDIGDLEITADKTKTASWSPMIGVAVMTAGGIIFILGGKKG